jgi:replicative superfamily II helicase
LHNVLFVIHWQIRSTNLRTDIMAIIASFIGINKYSDPNIRDLAGAVRDATALWALFSDTIPDIRSQLIPNNEATLERVRRTFDESLGAAQPDDVVILSFAGHGTHDHRLVVHDTVIGDLENTTIPMAELAERFTKSQAKTILCILDCCFSGNAPARVLEDSPIARDPANPFQMVAGKGRILIAASNFDEVSYEMPGGGHGLLTKALVDVLQEGTNAVEIQSAMGKVMEHVRAASARLGVTQTPVLYGQIEGGLTFPVLKPAKIYFDQFPEAKGANVSANIVDLSVFGFPDGVLTEWSDRFKDGLNDLQLEAVNEKRILSGESLFVVAPTSSGKTFIGEMTAVKSVLQGRKAVFLLPYKALTNEKYDQFSRLYGDRLGLRVIRCTGDRLDDAGPFIRGKYDLALLTYEMFLGLALSTPSVLNQIGLVVLDEAQFITDPSRGITVELLLTHLITAREKGIVPQLIVLSAVIGSVNSFDEWLGCNQLVTTTRPVPLIEGVLDRSGVFEYLDEDGQVKTTQLLSYGEVRQRRDKPSSQDVIVPLVRKLLSENPTEQIIIFRNNRGAAAGCAGYLAAESGLPPATMALAELPTHDLSTNSARLRACLQGGTAFHNTNLSPQEKEVVERAFRDSGTVRVLGATTTVAAGINTPASTVILAEQEFLGDDGRPFSIAEYKNMAGRAGRLGYSEKGKAIILADNQYERATLLHRYVLGNLEPLRSSFDPKHTETWIIRLLAQMGRIKRKDVARLLANTYGGYLANLMNPEWQQGTEQSLDRLLTEFIKLGLVEEEGNEVQLTLLGQVCGRSSLQFSSAMRLINLLKSASSSALTIMGLISVTQGLPELDGIRIPIAKTGRKENRKLAQSETRWPGEAIAQYGHELVQSLQRHADDFFAWYARCKRALILSDWIQGVPMEVIEQRYTVNAFNAVEYGHVRSVADTTRFHLRAAHQIASVIFIGQAPDDSALETLLKQLEVGLPADALELLEIPVQMTRGECLALYDAGVKSASELWALPAERVTELVGKQQAKQIEKARPR